MMVVRQEHVTFLDTETHSQDRDIVVEPPPCDSLNFAVAIIHVPEKIYVYMFVCNRIEIRISRGRKGDVGMRPEGISLAYLAP